MTLHIGAYDASNSMLVGDRLLSRSGKRWDPYANKTILLLAKNASIALGYSGLAQIRARSTGGRWVQSDVWLAQRIVKAVNPTIRFENFGTIFAVEKFNFYLRDVVEAVKAALDEDFMALPPRIRSNGLAILMVGFVWNAPNSQGIVYPRPIAIRIYHNGRVGGMLTTAARPGSDEVGYSAIGQYDDELLARLARSAWRIIVLRSTAGSRAVND